MADQNTKQIVQEQFNRLPKQIQDAITNSGWEQKIRSIARKYDLVVGEAGTLELETLLVMLGLENPKDYKKNIQREIGLSDEKANTIIKAVDEQIFKDIKKKLIELHEADERALETAEVIEETKEEIGINKTPEQSEELISPENNTVETKEVAETETSNINTNTENIKREMSAEGLDIVESDEGDTKPANQPIAESTTKTADKVDIVKENTQSPKITSSEKVEFDPYREPVDLDDMEI
jgi:hypothetical protein